MKILSLLFLVISFSHAWAWKEIRSEDGIKVYKKKVEGSGLLAFRAEGLIDMPYAKSLALLRDVEEATAWDEALKKKITVQDISDIEAVTYSVVDMPWPLKNRDLVVTNKLHYDPATMELVVKSSSVDHANHPPNDTYVRAHIKFANFRFKPVNGKTQLKMEVHVEPKGSITDWVINMVQKDMPMDFIQRLRKHTAVYKKGPNKGVWDMIQAQMADLQSEKKKLPASVSSNN